MSFCCLAEFNEETLRSNIFFEMFDVTVNKMKKLAISFVINHFEQVGDYMRMYVMRRKKQN